MTGDDATVGHEQPIEPEEAETLHELSRRGSRAALQLAMRSLALRGLTFAGSLVLARLLSPSDFGVYGIVGFVIAIWSGIGDFGLGASIVQQAEKPSREQLATVWTAQQLIAVTAVASIWLVAPLVRNVTSSLPGDVTWMVRVLSLGLLLSSLRTLPAVMMERELRFGPLAAAEIAQQGTFYAVAIGLAATGHGPWSFVLGGISQLAVGALVVNLAYHHRPAIGLNGAALRAMFGFGFAYQTSNVILTLRDAPLPAIAGLAAGTVAAGILQFALRMAMTISTIDEMVARIAFPAFSRLQGHPEQQGRALDTAILMSGLILVTAQFWLAAIAPLAVPFVFGRRWDDAIVPLQLICIATLLRFPARYLRQAEFANGATRQGVAMSAVTTVLTLGFYVAGVAAWGIPGGALGFLVGSGFGLVASIWLARGTAVLSWYRFWMMIAAGMAAAGAATLTLFGTLRLLGYDSATHVPIATAVVTGAITSAVYAFVCLALLIIGNRPAIELGWRLASQSIGRRKGSETSL